MEIIKDLTDLELLEELRRWKRLQTIKSVEQDGAERLVIDGTVENLTKEAEKRRLLISKL